MVVYDGAMSRKASSPFDDIAADIVLRTCDGVDFYVYRIILSLGSPFFKSMFSLKQPGNSDDTLVLPEGQPMINMPETSQTLDHLLRLCYPITDPVIKDIRDIGDVLEAAMKYEMEQPTVLMKKLFRNGSSDQPLEVFAVACRLHMEEEAAVAARIWRATMPFIPERPTGRNTSVDWNRTIAGQTYIDHMSDIPAGAYFRLLRFVRGDEVPWFCDPPTTSTHLQDPLSSTKPTILPDFNGEGADIIIRSSDGVDFPVHKAIISFATSVLSAGITLPSSSKPLPVLQVNEHSTVLDLAIQLCYPLEDPSITDAEVAVQLLHFSTAHKARRAKDFVRRRLTSFSDLHPLRMFFIAAQQRWEAEAREAVLLVLHSDVETIYDVDMELVPARVYRAFLKYHHECFRILTDITYQNTYPAVVLPKTRSVARLAEGYARVAPVIYSPIVDHAVSLAKANRFQITLNFEAMRSDSERVLDEIQSALEEVEIEL